MNNSYILALWVSNADSRGINLWLPFAKATKFTAILNSKETDKKDKGKMKESLWLMTRKGGTHGKQ
jgi:hypothetical protein